jgi:hypothetical protein
MKWKGHEKKQSVIYPGAEANHENLSHNSQPPGQE